MKIHKLDVKDFDEINYDLIALNTAIEDYHLAFNLNQNLNLYLKRESLDIFSSVNASDQGFSKYVYYDEKFDVYWSLVQNQKWIASAQSDFSLFDNSDQKIFLLPEFRNVDFFLKIENADFDVLDVHQIISHIKNINQVSAALWLDTDKIKSKNNLIF